LGHRCGYGWVWDVGAIKGLDGNGIGRNMAKGKKNPPEKEKKGNAKRIVELETFGAEDPPSLFVCIVDGQMFFPYLQCVLGIPLLYVFEFFFLKKENIQHSSIYSAKSSNIDMLRFFGVVATCNLCFVKFNGQSICRRRHPDYKTTERTGQKAYQHSGGRRRGNMHATHQRPSQDREEGGMREKATYICIACVCVCVCQEGKRKM
jgi:hypothetical protein